MKAKQSPAESADLFRSELSSILNPEHGLLKLAQLIDWEFFTREWAGYFPSSTGRPATAPRLVAGLLYLQHTYQLSDEVAVSGWLENPYWQSFCGMKYFQHELPLDASTLVRWRKRLGKAGVEQMLSKTIEAALDGGVVRRSSLERVVTDTTVMEKAVTYPTATKLVEAGRRRLVKEAKEANLKLRQNYNRVSPALSAQAARYAHARQSKRMTRSMKHHKTITGRVVRDIERQLPQVSSEPQRQRLAQSLSLVRRVLGQQRQDKGKVYSLHEPAVDCICKGKSRCRYEFGTKVSVTTTWQDNLVVGMCSLPGNPYDGHTLDDALRQVAALTNIRSREVYVDRGYRGHGVTDAQVYITGQRRGISAAIRKRQKRRNAVEPIIGHTKADGRLGRCPLKGIAGDANFAALCGCGQNLRLIFRRLQAFWHLFLSGLLRLSRSCFAASPPECPVRILVLPV